MWNQSGLPWGARLVGMGQNIPGQPGSLYAAQEPGVRRAFKEARQRFSSAMGALSPGNIRARQEGEAGMAAQESEILSALQQRSKQEEFENLMRLLAIYGRTAGGGGGGPESEARTAEREAEEALARAARKSQLMGSIVAGRRP